jgi:hypothetical protein
VNDEDVCYGWENGKAKIIDCAGTDVEDVLTQPNLDFNQAAYDVLGRTVDLNSYRGIVIQNGCKFLLF